MKSLLLILLTYSFPFGGFSQTKMTLDEIVKELAAYGPVINTTTFDGSPSRQVVLLNELNETASEADLLRLLHHDKLMVKPASYWALDDVAELNVTSYFDPDLQVMVINGCMMQYESLSNILQRRNPLQEAVSSPGIQITTQWPLSIN